MEKLKVGIIGNGYVGEAISYAFSSFFELSIFDINPLKSKNDLHSTHACDFVFVCVPTPMLKNGSQDLSFVDSVFKNATKKPIYILKSTVLPGTTESLIKKYNNIKIVFSPEFLTEKNSKKDIINPSRIILGGQTELINKVKKLIELRFQSDKIILTDSKTAELIKYMNNAFLATKVSIMNEFKLLSDNIEANWEDALKGFVADVRIGNSHFNVPGHDGKLGYGGTCFPKDVNAILSFSKRHDIEMNTIKGGWKTNLNVRPEMDWENDEGRSVYFKKTK
jgi:nucleotide sugar dehydrogenase